MKKGLCGHWLPAASIPIFLFGGECAYSISTQSHAVGETGLFVDRADQSNGSLTGPGIQAINNLMALPAQRWVRKRHV